MCFHCHLIKSQQSYWLLCISEERVVGYLEFELEKLLLIFPAREAIQSAGHVDHVTPFRLTGMTAE